MGKVMSKLQNRIELDFPNNIIYKIVHKNERIKLCYVGRTNNFNKRQGEHKRACWSSDTKLYETMRKYGGFGNFTMTALEIRDCIDERAANQRELKWMKKLRANMNTKMMNQLYLYRIAKIE